MSWQCQNVIKVWKCFFLNSTLISLWSGRLLRKGTWEQYSPCSCMFISVYQRLFILKGQCAWAAESWPTFPFLSFLKYVTMFSFHKSVSFKDTGGNLIFFLLVFSLGCPNDFSFQDIVGYYGTIPVPSICNFKLPFISRKFFLIIISL